MPSSEDRAFHKRALEASIRIGLIALLVIWCFEVVRPFIQPIVWGIILAIAIHPAYLRLGRVMGGRERLAATSLVVGSLLLLIVPSVMITTSLVESATELAGKLREGEVKIPPPPTAVADWPIIGGGLHALWAEASRDLEAALRQAQPLLKAIGRWMLSGGATAGFGIVMFALSIVIAGVLLSYGEQATDTARRIARRLVDERGDELVRLTGDTVESVTRGILGVALIQGLLAGIGLLVAGVPAAGLWALLVLLMAVVQIPTVLILGPIIVYVFATSSTTIAVLFAIWSLAVGFSDNVLKPMLLGRGVDVPTLVIFMGAIGGFILQGIIGLFAGAVVLSVGYTLFKAWLEDVS
ncbi:MAG: AI-2E family transporter [Myxococcales bacterium]|nr:AI-2E family transporter [Myxococcales bacterium]